MCSRDSSNSANGAPYSSDSPLLILGASVRAAAQSARRANFSVLAADLFADLDLQRCCPAIRVADYPSRLTAVAETAPPGPWMYTGGLENHPELVAEISRRRRLYGNPPDVLVAVRDPMRVKAALQRVGVHVPRVSRSPAGLPQDGSWLQKPLWGSGGAGIRSWRGGEVREHDFFQEFIAGQCISAVYVAAGGNAVLLGATRQLVGSDWTGAGRFAYCGSLGPLLLSPKVLEQFVELGCALSRHFGLAGLFGIDAVLADDRVWTIEINPRYTASVEVLERAVGCHAVGLHAAACLRERLPAFIPRQANGCCGKAVVYAQRNVRVTEDFLRLAAFNWETPWPDLADIPESGTQIRAGRPIATVLAQAADEPSLLAELRRRAALVHRAVYREETALGEANPGL